MQKQCTKCMATKTIDCFHKSAATKDGYCYICKECAIKKAREHQRLNREAIKKRKHQYWEQNKEKIKKARREYYLRNQEKIRKANKAYNATHKEEKRITDKLYRETNRDKIRKRKSEYYYKNKDVIAQKNRLYYLKNRKERVRKSNEYRKNRSKEDPLFAFTTRIRNLIHVSLYNKGYSKKSTTARILGVSYSQVWSYLLCTWEKNYGTNWNGEPYHIDHIVPLATAKTEEDVIRLCHYTNLQMLTPSDNLAKGAMDNRDAWAHCRLL